MPIRHTLFEKIFQLEGFNRAANELLGRIQLVIRLLHPIERFRWQLLRRCVSQPNDGRYAQQTTRISTRIRNGHTVLRTLVVVCKKRSTLNSSKLVKDTLEPS